MNVETFLATELLSEYPSHGRPVVEVEDVVDVRTDLILQAVQNVDEQKHEISTLVWLSLSWNDMFLGWNRSEYGNSKIWLLSSDVWTPDIEVYNAVKTTNLRQYQDMVEVTNTGDVSWVRPLLITTPCNMKLESFPFDQQECLLRLGSWLYSGEELDIILADGSKREKSYQEHPEWSLLGTSAETQVVFYDGTEEPFLDVTYTVKIRRESDRYVNTIIIPVFIATILTILSTLVPHHLPTVRLIILLFTGFLICFFTLSKESHTGYLGNLVMYSYFCVLFLILHSILLLTYVNTLSTKPAHNSATWQDMPDRDQLARLADFLVTALLLCMLVWRWSFVLLV